MSTSFCSACNWPPLYSARAEIDEMESKLLAFDQYLTWPVGQTDGSALCLVLVLHLLWVLQMDTSAKVTSRE